MAKQYFKLSLELAPEIAYSHNRISESIRAQEEQAKKYKTYIGLFK
jgi:hypothetical protein